MPANQVSDSTNEQSPSITQATKSAGVPSAGYAFALKRRGRLWIVVAIVVVLAIVAWTAMRGPSPVANAAQKTPPPTSVVAVVAHQGDIDVYFSGLGTVTPLYTVTVKSRVDGQILNVLYKEGQLVRKGNPLVEIDPRPYQVQLTQAEGQLAKDQAALQNAQVDLKRYQTLIAKNAVAQQIEATQKATVIQDQGAVTTDEGNVAAAKLNIIYCHIASPIDGRVGLRLVDPGNMITATAGTGLVVITQTNPISVIFTLPEQQLSPVLKRIRAGQRLPVDALDRDSKTIIAHGQLETLDNQIDQTTGTLKLRATFTNKDGVLFPNQFVNAQLLVQEKQNVTLVPKEAIQRNGPKTFVYLVKADHTVTVRDVSVGTSDAVKSEILSGVSPGDVLVTQGVDKLQEGSLVQAQIQRPGNTVAPSAYVTKTADITEADAGHQQ